MADGDSGVPYRSRSDQNITVLIKEAKEKMSKSNVGVGQIMYHRPKGQVPLP